MCASCCVPRVRLTERMAGRIHFTNISDTYRRIAEGVCLTYRWLLADWPVSSFVCKFSIVLTM